MSTETAGADQNPGAIPASPSDVHIPSADDIEHADPNATPARGRALLVLVLTALGVVYGDIGTSPLYALRECFSGVHGIDPSPANIFGVLSLTFWALIIVITIKYIVFILRADNHGEGGILALAALATPIRRLVPSPRRWLVLLGVIRAALLYGDGIITPAISVLSAVEGLRVAPPVRSLRHPNYSCHYYRSVHDPTRRHGPYWRAVRSSHVNLV